MREHAAKRDPNRCPSHLGALLGEVIAATGKSKAETAAHFTPASLCHHQ
jgi:hypothetical protein